MVIRDVAGNDESFNSVINSWLVSKMRLREKTNWFFSLFFFFQRTFSVNIAPEPTCECYSSGPAPISLDELEPYLLTTSSLCTVCILVCICIRIRVFMCADSFTS